MRRSKMVDANVKNSTSAIPWVNMVAGCHMSTHEPKTVSLPAMRDPTLKATH